MTDNTLDRAVQAAAEALRNQFPNHDFAHWVNNQVARIAVEAAASHMPCSAQAPGLCRWATYWKRKLSGVAENAITVWRERAERAEAETIRALEMQEEQYHRAERAEAEVERLKACGNIERYFEEADLADRLAEALLGSTSRSLALAAYEEARNDR